MNKQEYINRLNELLTCLPVDHRLESISFYEEMIDDRIEDGMTEEQAVAALDAPGVAAEKILDDLPAVPRAVAKTRRKSRALLWGAAIIGSPLWVALALAFAATVLGIYLCIWLIAVCIWVIAIGGILCLPLGTLLAFWGIEAGNVAFALWSFGGGLVGSALGALCARGAFAASRQLALLSRKWLRRALSLFTDMRKRPKGGPSADEPGVLSGPGGSSRPSRSGKKPAFVAASKNV